MIVFTQRGNFNHIEKFLNQATRTEILRILDKYGREGVAALAAATPKDTGLTSNSWGYETHYSNGSYVISWTNSHIINGVPIAVIIQYGHGTRNGGYVEGRDYINPTMKEVFDKIANEAWREVTKT